MKKASLLITALLVLACIFVSCDNSGKIEKEKYTVTFDSNGGTGTMSSEVFVAGEPKALSANTFENGGRPFAGWSTDIYPDIEYTDQQVITPTSNMKLYAVWGDDFTGRWVADDSSNSYVVFDGVDGFSFDIILGDNVEFKGNGTYLKEDEIVQPLFIPVPRNSLGFVITEPMTIDKQYAFVKIDGNKAWFCQSTSETVDESAYATSKEYDVSFSKQIVINTAIVDMTYENSPAFSEVYYTDGPTLMKVINGYGYTAGSSTGSISADAFVTVVDYNKDNSMTAPVSTKWLMNCHDADRYEDYVCPFAFENGKLKLTFNKKGTPVTLTFTRQ